LQVLAAVRLQPDRERRLVDLFYYQGKTLNQAGREMGFHRSWASRLHAPAILPTSIEKNVPTSLAAAQKQLAIGEPIFRRAAPIARTATIACCGH
jgi:RNA polymerase sigma factor for flagellar operon FliA